MYPSAFSPKCFALETISYEDFIYKLKKVFFKYPEKKNIKLQCMKYNLLPCVIYIDISLMLTRACNLSGLILCKYTNIR